MTSLPRTAGTFVGCGAVLAACANLAGLGGGATGNDGGTSDGRGGADVAGGDARSGDAEGDATGADASTNDAANGDAELFFDGNCNCGPGCSVVVANGLSGPDYLAADTKGVYWVNPTPATVEGVEFGGPVQRIAHDDGGSAGGVALTSNTVVWVDFELGKVFGAARGSTSPLVVVGGGHGVTAETSIATAQDSLYFTFNDGIGDCQVPNAALCTPTPLVSGASGFLLMAADPANGYVAWTTSSGVFGCPLMSPDCASSASDFAGAPVSLRVAGSTIYWLDFATPQPESLRVATIGETDGGFTTLHTFPLTTPALDLAVDDASHFVFWVDGSGNVSRAPTSSGVGVPIVIAHGPSALYAKIAVNGTCVFWSVDQGTPGTGSVRAAPE